MVGQAAQQRSSSTREQSHADRIAAVEATELPPSVAALADEYDRAVGERDRFLWKWIHNLFDAFTLPCVPSSSWETVKESKTVLTMFITTLDDLADQSGGGPTFEQARRIPYAPESIDCSASDVDAGVVEFARRLWEDVNDRLTHAPCHEDHRDVFGFDLRQAMNSMEYARVLNDNRSIANLSESRHYGPFNMVMFPYAGIDLMWTPEFDRGELGELRRLLLELQKMARIGNWVTTWERELFEDDYTAGVVVEALERNLITPEDDPNRAISTIHEAGLRERFEAEWESRYADVSSQEFDIESFEVDRLIEGMRTVMEHHLASDGQK